jgi:C-terminal processing protease CtpA/Prc
VVGRHRAERFRRTRPPVFLRSYRATFEDHDKKYVYLVEDNNVARKREITVRAEVDDEFVVEAGIKVGDRIVSDGVGKVHDGDKVKD